MRARKNAPTFDEDYQLHWFFKNIFNFILKVASEGAVLISWLNYFQKATPR